MGRAIKRNKRERICLETSLNPELITISEIIQQISGVSSIEPDKDFYEAGLTSVMALPLLMELEERFGVSIPDDKFVEARTPRALHHLITELGGVATR
jgi:acyl carrier protein